MPAKTRTDRVSEPRERLLRTASTIFYTKGIHAVGVEEIVDTAEVTRSTLYRHFRSKEELVVAYLRAASQGERSQVAALLTEDQSAADAVRTVARAVAGQIANPMFRGCAFLNAAAEYPDPDHPVHQAILEHRQWYFDLVAAQMERLAGRPARDAAEVFVLLRDGAMTAGCLADRERVTASFLQGVDDLVLRVRAA
ncbi:TetR/AcrR family transcriptional regulator [Nocardioides sp. TF02-7]|uniref:TetR/AcrR family transcriptional regulator n=1 Tax=Nocardioides sp. TF02-7 TaxID=2917724 RepID=UPI001F06F06F|nr:TetR/AcrR family transcriptional regulator [Nocardioides sp. TF02-7]UMG91585.1 TetR/AcrR family transcriptional regulator [Nocardioides sp. TF02-7]